MTIATKKPRAQTKMSNSVSETSQVTRPNPNPPPSSSSPWIHVVCERALTLLKAVIIKIPSIKPTPKNPPINPKYFQRCFVTRNDNENRDEVEEDGKGEDCERERVSIRKTVFWRKKHLPPPPRKAEASSVFHSPSAGCSGDERGKGSGTQMSLAPTVLLSRGNFCSELGMVIQREI